MNIIAKKIKKTIESRREIRKEKKNKGEDIKIFS